MRVLLVDNYDSFTYNIAQIIKNLPDVNLQIIRAGDINTDSLDVYDRIIFSPGPDLPRRGNIMEKILEKLNGRKPVLGICLGLQAIVLFYGGKLLRLEEVAHGRSTIVTKTGKDSLALKDLPECFEAGLYHSWVTDPASLPDSLIITALSAEGRVMGIKHNEHTIEGIQFHPESIMTPFGDRIISTWLSG
jgi:anthranilate synthase component 2